MINKKLKNGYKVKWQSDVFTPHYSESNFSYSYSGPLAERFKTICNMIINHIELKGNISKVAKLTVDDGVIITERLPNGEIINAHLVYIGKTN